MGVSKRGLEIVDCDASKHYFDRDRGNELMEQFVQTGTPTDELISMVRMIYVKLTKHPDYAGYDNDTKEDMISQAFYEFLKYGHNFKVNRARNGAYTFCNWNARNSFNRYLKQHYKHKNLNEALSDECVVEDWHELYNQRLTENRDSEPEVVLDSVDT